MAAQNSLNWQKSTQQQYEYLLFGSVPESNVQSLLHRLRGLCDFATTGGLTFTDREIAYRIGGSTGGTKVRARQSLDAQDAPWHLIYTGQLELGDTNRPTAVRTCTTAACSSNLLDIVKELGFVPMSELILKGYIFKKGQIKISVFKIFLPSEASDSESTHAFSDHYLVELSAVMPSGQDSIGNEMKTLADSLKPIVAMEKTDGLR